MSKVVGTHCVFYLVKVQLKCNTLDFVIHCSWLAEVAMCRALSSVGASLPDGRLWPLCCGGVSVSGSAENG